VLEGFGEVKMAGEFVPKAGTTRFMVYVLFLSPFSEVTLKKIFLVPGVNFRSLVDCPEPSVVQADSPSLHSSLAPASRSVADSLARHIRESPVTVYSVTSGSKAGESASAA